MHEGHQPSTHLMSDDGDKTAWPTLFQTKEGVWYQPDNPEDEARATGEIYKFDTHEEMVNFARKGNWKTKKINMINWINSWKAGNKKDRYELALRISTLTVFELMFCPCWKCEKKSCKRFRFMILNLGFEI